MTEVIRNRRQGRKEALDLLLASGEINELMRDQVLEHFDVTDKIRARECDHSFREPWGICSECGAP